MLRHTGQRRSLLHNLRLAVLLSANAGFINAAGFIAFNVLTTNVTGHAALLAVDIASANIRSARMVLLWLALFFGGAFFSGVLITKVGRDKAAAYTIPILIITTIIFCVALFGNAYNHTLPQTEIFAGALLFAMGMQNALVSMISGSVVRTTHLTGMFTDLGIDVSWLLFNKINAAIKNRLLLRGTIIISFLAGGILGGIIFLRNSFSAFYIPVCLLLLALFYDYFRVKVLRAINK